MENILDYKNKQLWLMGRRVDALLPETLNPTPGQMKTAAEALDISIAYAFKAWHVYAAHKH